MANQIEEQLIRAGYSLIGDTAPIIKLISEILHTKNERYIKTIPYLLYKYPLTKNQWSSLAKNELFLQISSITKQIFEKENIAQEIPLQLPPSQLNFTEFYNEFLTQYKAKQSLLDTQKTRQERDQHFWLSQLFTPKEKAIILKILANTPISKTDYEYYSRKTKKKAKAIIHLQPLAQILSETNPTKIIYK